MPADRWTQCPQCKERLAGEKTALVNKIQEEYGKVSEHDYHVLLGELQERNERELKRALREDWEIGIRGGFLEIWYGAGCSECGFSHKFATKRLLTCNHSATLLGCQGQSGKEIEMKTLPNGLTVFNGTPHVIRFWDSEWQEPVEVKPDVIISAAVRELSTFPIFFPSIDVLSDLNIQFVFTEFLATEEGQEIMDAAYGNEADLVIGSIIAAQAYPGLVVAMIPAEGYERVPPAEKRMRPDKFTVF